MNARTRVLSFLGASLIRLLGRTWRLRVVDRYRVDEARKIAPQVIFVFWHGRMLVPAYTHRDLGIVILASAHRDGELMGQTVRRLGFGHVRGSSTRGGARAIRELVARLETGFDLGLTVDGPKGPRHVCKPGPLQIAKLSGCAIVPAAIGSRRYWQLSSWDGFQIPRPFTRVQIMFGQPMRVPADASTELIEEQRQRVETSLREITERNDENLREH